MRLKLLLSRQAQYLDPPCKDRYSPASQVRLHLAPSKTQTANTCSHKEKQLTAGTPRHANPAPQRSFHASRRNGNASIGLSLTSLTHLNNAHTPCPSCAASLVTRTCHFLWQSFEKCPHLLQLKHWMSVFCFLPCMQSNKCNAAHEHASEKGGLTFSTLPSRLCTVVSSALAAALIIELAGLRLYTRKAPKRKMKSCGYTCTDIPCHRLSPLLLQRQRRAVTWPSSKRCHPSSPSSSNANPISLRGLPSSSCSRTHCPMRRAHAHTQA